MYVVGVNPHHFGYPLVFVENNGISHTCMHNGRFEDDDGDGDEEGSDMDLVRHLPECDSFEWSETKT